MRLPAGSIRVGVTKTTKQAGFSTGAELTPMEGRINIRPRVRDHLDLANVEFRTASIMGSRSFAAQVVADDRRRQAFVGHHPVFHSVAQIDQRRFHFLSFDFRDLSGSEQLFNILRWAGEHGSIGAHHDRPLDQIRMFRHESDQFFIRELLFADAQLLRHWFVLA